MDDAIELADLIWQLRSELTRAMMTGEGKELRFRADVVELELTVAVEKSRDPKLAIKFWVLDASAGSKRAATTTQKLRLSLRPVSGDGETSALISGESFANEK